MQVVLKDFETGAKIEPLDHRLNDDEFFAFCAANPDLRIEREANGEIIIMPPAGGETGYRNNDLSRQLGNWAKADGRGRAFDSNTEFILPDGAAYAPDAAWVLKSRLAALSKRQLREFLPLCPDFIVELTSPSDRLPRVQKKMLEWMENGAQLGWLIDADERTVYLYCRGREAERIVNPDSIDGEGPVAGFRLELTDIWEGL